MCVITEKKLQQNIARLCCHNFLSLVVFWLGGPKPPARPGYAYVCSPLQNASVAHRWAMAHSLKTTGLRVVLCATTEH